jgi:alcohol dehydrogenase class IV
LAGAKLEAPRRRAPVAAAMPQDAPASASGLRPRTAFGPGAVAALGDLVREQFDARRAVGELLLVTGQTFDERPWGWSIRSALKGLGVSHCTHGPGSPTEASIAPVAQAAVGSAAGVIVAVGGGSVIDAAKVAASWAAREGAATVPVVAVPTTPGTGSESTPFATVWDYEAGRKTSVAAPAPAVAVVDPELTLSLPRQVLAGSALDALTQGAEAAWSTESSPESVALGLSAVSLIARSYEPMMASPADSGARVAASLAGLHSGWAMGLARTNACHAISYPLTLRHGLLHGHACSLALGGLLAFNAEASDHDCVDARGVAHVWAVVGRLVRALEVEDASAACGKLDRFHWLGGLPRYRECQVDSERLAADAMTYDRMDQNPRRLTQECLAALLRSL